MRTIQCTSLAFVVLSALPTLRASTTENGNATFDTVFLVAGVPGTWRGDRVDLALTDERLVVHYRKIQATLVSIHYPSIRRVRFLAVGRRYPGAAAATADLTPVVNLGAFGSPVILAKHSVETLVIDYVNPRGGFVGVALQLPKGEGLRCARLLAAHGIKVEELIQGPESEEDRPRER